MISNQDNSSLVLFTGLSGAGKSTALNIFSDCGYYVVDNLPVPLIPNLLDHIKDNTTKYRKTALLLDVYSKNQLEQLLDLLSSNLVDLNTLNLVFLDANDSSILKRYSETRRPHPGFDAERDRTLVDTIQRERNRLIPFKEKADYVVDTTTLTVHDLKRLLQDYIQSITQENTKKARLNFLSFGFKYGAPIDCDLVVDVRFLPNPYFVEALRDKTGQAKDVAKYVLTNPDTKVFLSKYVDLLSFLLPKFIFEGKSYINIGIGCTGGKHRSVAIAEKLHELVQHDEFLISVKHRDISK